MAVLGYCKNSDGEILAPYTFGECVTMADGQSLEQEVGELSNNITSLIKKKTVTIQGLAPLAQYGSADYRISLSEISSGEYTEVLPCVRTNTVALLAQAEVNQGQLLLSLRNVSNATYPTSTVNKTMDIYLLKSL